MTQPCPDETLDGHRPKGSLIRQVFQPLQILSMHTRMAQVTELDAQLLGVHSSALPIRSIRRCIVVNIYFRRAAIIGSIFLTFPDLRPYDLRLPLRFITTV